MSTIQKEPIFKVTNCRACNSTQFRTWVNLGKQPVANNLLNDPKDPEEFYPLTLIVCDDCQLVQTSHVVNPDILFGDYLYRSSVSEVFRDHFKALAKQQFDTDKIKKGDFVVDIGSNDGVLLKPFQELGAKVLGIEPADKIADYAQNKGIDTLPFYFNTELAGRIVDEYGEAELVTATNVFAHVNDVAEILEGVAFLLKPGGRFMIEVAYLGDMLAQGTFDLIYHEHLCYWSLWSLQRLLNKNGFTIDSYEHIPVHGGSIRVFAKLKVFPDLGKMIKDDRGMVFSPAFYGFPIKLTAIKSAIVSEVRKIKEQKKTIIGYGAPAKMSTMTNYFDLGPEHIDYIIEDAPSKQGKYSPGKHIKIVAPVDFKHVNADYIFIFAWNFADSIMLKCKSEGFKGKFIIPFPKLRIV